jgi:hypothetical protein
MFFGGMCGKWLSLVGGLAFKTAMFVWATTEFNLFFGGMCGKWPLVDGPHFFTANFFKKLCNAGSVGPTPSTQP